MFGVGVADVPHFCGAEDCLVEGRYEVRIEHDESLWANREERDATLQALENWGGGGGRDEEGWD